MRSIKDEFGLYRETIFDDMLLRERKRTERSQKSFAMIMVEVRHLLQSRAKKSIRHLTAVFDECFREIDIQGWYRQRSVIGIICPEVERENVKALQLKVENALQQTLSPLFLEKLKVSFVCFPEKRDDDAVNKNRTVYPELKASNTGKAASDIVKRSMDFFAALIGMALLFPLFILLAVLIKLTSKGPVFFRQKRVGLLGREFTLFKFRSMKVDNDDSAHKAFVKDFINAGQSAVADNTQAFKLVKDKRITGIGQFLRKTSLDELPQLINVLRGDMSLVGPRPPIQYEVDEYRIWHRRRVMEVKPGITGFWQVHGRSVTSFETMVRMDIYYIKYRNLLLDLLLLIKTPLALLRGAY